MCFVTFGEIMLRLTPQENRGKIVTATAFNVSYAGSESNIASSLSILGNDTQFVTKLPLNSLGDGALRSLRGHGIQTDFIVRGGNRIGTYFIEMGSSIRPSRVVYDRAGSAIAMMEKSDFDWEEILKGKNWLHVSGITPALSKACAEATMTLVKTARKMGVKVSFDLNFRRSLWNDRTHARKIFDAILEHTDLLIANTGAIADVYQANFKDSDHMERSVQAINWAKQCFGVGYLGFTVREHRSASHNILAGLLLSDKGLVRSPVYDLQVIDRFGSGDAFVAGLLHGLNQNWTTKETLDFATAAFALKHTIPGDQNISTVNEIKAIMDGKTSGWVIR